MRPGIENATQVRNCFKDLRRFNDLHAAWQEVQRSGRASQCSRTRREVGQFGEDVYGNLRRIQAQLRTDRFDFGAPTGVPIQRPGKAPRPIVVASLEARIVQRALLDQLQALPELQKYLDCPTSFGGIPGKGVGPAVNAVREALSSHTFFIRSDIKSFFTKIPKAKALAAIRALVDVQTGALLDAACTSELANAHELGELIEHFPTEDVGAPQGLCLSPLLGNIVLHNFDVEMNSGTTRCLRYVDDFLILAPDEQLGRRAFKQAQRLLGDLGMSAYDPSSDKQKTEHGFIKNGLEFLGVSIQPGLVRPSRAATKKVAAAVKEILDVATRELRQPMRRRSNGYGLQRTLFDVANVLQGWRGSYQFCDAHYVFRDVDRKIDAMLGRFLREYGKAYRLAEPNEKRDMLGVPVLEDDCRSSARPARRTPQPTSP